MLSLIDLQLKWYIYIIRRCAADNRGTHNSIRHSWYSCCTCCGDHHSGYHYGSSDRNSHCKEQTLPTLHSDKCSVSHVVLSYIV